MNPIYKAKIITYSCRIAIADSIAMKVDAVFLVQFGTLEFVNIRNISLEILLLYCKRNRFLTKLLLPVP